MTNSHTSSERNPFRNYGEVKADTDRFKRTLKELPAHLSGTALDIGVENPFTAILKQTYPDLKIVNTPAEVDFDVDVFPFADKSFDVILSFEVLEHLMNPLWNLMECRRVLKDGGTIYVTTPKGGFPSTFMWWDAHFHEIDRKRIHILSNRANLRIKCIKRFNRGPFQYWKIGIIRPTVRIFLGGFFYIEMEKE